MTNTEIEIANFFVKREGEGILDSIYEMDFIDSGIIDSLDLLLLASYIEESFGVKLNLMDESTFTSIRKFNSLVQLVNDKIK